MKARVLELWPKMSTVEPQGSPAAAARVFIWATVPTYCATESTYRVEGNTVLSLATHIEETGSKYNSNCGGRKG